MRLVPLVLAVLCAACVPAPSDSMPALSNVHVMGALSAPDLVEASGLVKSTLEPNVFWAQNDSGNDERLFAFDSTGHALGQVVVTGAKNRDWEAIALGPCASGSCLFIGDVGDNGAHHQSVRIWRIPEPHVADTISPPAEMIRVQYVDGPHDVEAMFVGNDSAVYLISKRPERSASGTSRPVRVYRVDGRAWQSREVTIAPLFDSLPIVPDARDSHTWVTDAAIWRSAPALLAVRTYRDVFVFTLGADNHATELQSTCALSAFANATGEGVTWLDDHRLMFDAEGAHSRLHSGECPPVVRARNDSSTRHE